MSYGGVGGTRMMKQNGKGAPKHMMDVTPAKKNPQCPYVDKQSTKKNILTRQK